MTPSPPGVLRVIRLLAGIAVRRWISRYRGRFFAAFRPKRRRADGAPRTATPRKKVGSVLLTVLLGGMLLFNGVFIASQFVLKLTRHFDSQSAAEIGKTAVPERMYEDIVRTRMELDRLKARSDKEHQNRKTNVDVEKEIILSGLKGAMNLHAGFRTDSKERADALANEWMETFKEKGPAGFHPVSRSYPAFWPDTESWPGPAGQAKMLLAIGLMLTLLCASICLTTFGSANQDLGKVEWSMEWLFTFPVSSGVLFLAKVIEFTLINTFGWFLLFPLLFVAFWNAGYEWLALPVGVAAAFYLNSLLASVRLVGETFLRKRLTRSRLKNVQAGFAIAGMASLMFVLYLALAPSIPDVFFAAVDSLGAWFVWLPLSIPALLAGSGAVVWIAAACAAVFAVLFIRGGVLIAGRLVRNGLVAETGSYQGSRSPSSADMRRGSILKGVVGKDVRLLLRDRSFFAQTLILPLVLIAFQILINPKLFTAAASDFRHAAAIAFGVGGYVLMFGAFGVLSAEGKSLWLLYTFPRPIEKIMRRKALLWAGISSLYTIAVLIAVLARTPSIELSMLLNAGMAVAGVFVYAFIAAGIGVMGTDPLEQEVHRKIKPAMMYLYFLLAGMYAYGIYAPSVWNKIGMIVLCSLIAVAIWQKVRSRMPYLLDPTQLPPPRIDVSDGLIAVFAFFVIQGAGLLILTAGGVIPTGEHLVIAYSIAGVCVTLVSLLIFKFRKVPMVLATVGLRIRFISRASLVRGIGTGAALGAAAGLFGLLYIWLADSIEPLRTMKQETIRQTEKLGISFGYWLPILAVLVAPVFEEYIFRGLLYRGLRRAAGPVFSVLASAAIFAVVHPPFSVIPVFVLGLAAALSFQRARFLAAPIAAHVVYNAIVILFSR